MLNWQELRKDLPKQIITLCDFGSDFSSLLDISEKNKDFFSSVITLRSLVSGFERFRQYLKTIVFTKVVTLEKIKVPLVEYPIEEEEEKKMIALPIKKYIKKFEEDLKIYYEKIDEILKLETLDIKGKAKFFFDLRSFETYAYDIIDFSKKEFYKEVRSYDYEKRKEIKEKVTQVIVWKLEHLNEIAERILKEGVKEQHFPKLVTAIILTLKSISNTKETLEITVKKIKEDYFPIWLLISKIKNKQLKINNLANTTFLVTKIKIANTPPFNNFFNKLLKEEISHSFSFPTSNAKKIFWDIFLASIIQRAGLIPESKELAEKIKGRTEVMVG